MNNETTRDIGALYAKAGPKGREPYRAFILEADNSLEYLFGFPKESEYLFTESEYNRFIRRQGNTAERRLFKLGLLNLFLLPRPAVVAKMYFESVDVVVRLPIGLLRRAYKRSERAEKACEKKGIIDRVVKAVTEALRK